MTAIEIILGALVIAAVAVDIFLSVIVPRPTRSGMRLSSFFGRATWPAWRRIGLTFANSDRREGFLGIYAPLALVALLALWVVGLVVGFGIILFALRGELQPPPHDVGTAIYFAASSLLTVGFGDVIPAGPATRLLASVAAGTGLATFAIVVTFLFSLFGSFQRREQFVVAFDAVAGAPPSGVAVLETHARFAIIERLPDLFQRAQTWAADALQTHLAYPILAYFRSNHRDESWIATLGAVLDAAALLQTTVDGTGPMATAAGQGELAADVGVHLADDLVKFLAVPNEASAGPGVERAEYEQVRRQLAGAGYGLRPADDAWRSFALLRSGYAPHLNAIAKYWAIPPTQWIGDRSTLSRH